MTTVNDVFNFLCELAPLDLQMDFDNAGFLVGHRDSVVLKALVALDVTDDVIDEAVNAGCQLIVSHHPLIFKPEKSFTDCTSGGDKLLTLAENRIAVISMHTNLDIAQGGVNDVLMNTVGAHTEGALDADGCGRIGRFDAPMSMDEFLKLCREKLYANGLRYVDSGRPVERIAVMGGAGADSLEQAYRLGCDTYLTADIKYHQFLRARELGINLIDGDHFGTENPVVPYLASVLGGKFPNVEFAVSRRHNALVRFYI